MGNNITLLLKTAEIIQNQNGIIMKTLAEEKVLSERVLRQEVTNNNLRTVFPIRTINDLNELNNMISDDNRELYDNMMKSFLKGRFPKTLTEVISTSASMKVNVDGVHGKKRLKAFTAYFQALTDNCRSLGCNEVEKDLRDALKIIKKHRIHA